MVTPFSFSRSKYSQKDARSSGSTPTVGSSRKRSFGSCIMLQASDARCLIPPLRFDTSESRHCDRATKSSSSFSLSAILAGERP